LDIWFENKPSVNPGPQKLEEFPEALSKVSATIRSLDLSSNRIASIPAWIGNFKSLKTLNLR
jgi:Leucine-rich repeat (LRR) protein